MTTHLNLGIALVALATATTAMASNNLTVTGKLTPPACNAQFDGDATVDFGTIPFRSLASNGTQFEIKNSILHIDCGGPTRVSVVAHDNRAGSGITMAEAPHLDWPYQSVTIDKYSWGLGYANGADIKTGALITLVTPDTTSIDGTKLTEASTQKILARPTGTSGWAISSSHYSMNLNPGFEYSFGPAGGPAAPVQHVQLGMGLRAMIGMPSTLPHADEIPLNGSITFTLRYL